MPSSRILIAVAAVCFASVASAQPIAFSHVGRLFDGSDNPVEATGLQFTFRLYDQSGPVVAQRLIWEGSCTLAVHRGLYSAMLGSGCGTGLDPLMFSVAEVRWLEIAIDGQPLTPRLAIGMVPLAAHAINADSLGGVGAAQFLQRNEILDAGLFGHATPAEVIAANDARYAQIAVGGSPVQQGGLALSGEVRAGSFVGDGSALTNLPIPGDLVRTGQNATFASGVVLTGRFAGDGSALTNLPIPQIPADLVRTGQDATFSPGILVSGAFAGDGSRLTGLNAGALATGTLPDARLSGTYSGALTFSGNLNASTNLGIGTSAPNAKLDVNGAIRLGADTSACDANKAGALRYAAGRLELCTGGSWQALALASVTAGLTKETALASCKAIKTANPQATSGAYWISPDGNVATAFQAYCDMSVNGGGYTLCALFGNKKRGDGFNYTTTTWTTDAGGSRVFLNSTAAAVAFGNFCPTVGVSELYAQVRDASGSTLFTTGNIPTSGTNPFVVSTFPKLNEFNNGTNGWFALAARSTYASNGTYFEGGTCTRVSNNQPQATDLCVGDGTHFQEMMGNVNGTASEVDLMCQYGIACGASNGQILVYVR